PRCGELALSGLEYAEPERGPGDPNEVLMLLTNGECFAIAQPGRSHITREEIGIAEAGLRVSEQPVVADLPRGRGRVGHSLGSRSYPAEHHLGQPEQPGGRALQLPIG